MEDVQKAIIATICVLVLAGGGTLNNISERADTNGEDLEELQAFMVQLTLLLREVRQYMQQVVGL